MDEYLAAGGGAYADVVTFHGYLGSSNGVADPPENIASLIANMKGIMASYGQGSKELWDTEHSWGNDANLADQDHQAAWLARHVIVSWSTGVARSVWYLWDGADVGTLWDPVNGIHQAGRAYGEVYKWRAGLKLRLYGTALGLLRPTRFLVHIRNTPICSAIRSLYLQTDL